MGIAARRALLRHGLSLALLTSSCAVAPPPPAHLAPSALVGAPAIAPHAVDDGCDDAVAPPVSAVLHLSATQTTRALRPAFHAVCACTRPGEEVRVVATISPEEGRTVATVEDAPAIDACVKGMPSGRFDPLVVGSDCVGCGRPGETRIRFPFRFVHGARP